MMAQRLRVLIADDHPVVSAGLAALLQRHYELEVLGTPTRGHDAARMVLELSPDVAILDIGMPVLNGIGAIERIRERGNRTPVVVLSMHDSIEHVFRAMRAGANAYLLKDSAGAELVPAIRAVLAGREYLTERLRTPELAERLAAKGASPVESLTRREREVLQLVVAGKSSAEIATMLALSPKTVETYRSRLMLKLGISDLPTLVRFALQHGFTPAP
jgi:DNA-binding NarL/FixJ family response regulator